MSIPARSERTTQHISLLLVVTRSIDLVSSVASVCRTPDGRGQRWRRTADDPLRPFASEASPPQVRLEWTWSGRSNKRLLSRSDDSLTLSRRIARFAGMKADRRQNFFPFCSELSPGLGYQTLEHRIARTVFSSRIGALGLAINWCIFASCYPLAVPSYLASESHVGAQNPSCTNYETDDAFFICFHLSSPMPGRPERVPRKTAMAPQ